MSQSFPPIIPPNTTDATYSTIPQFVLSSQKSILENYNVFRSLSPSVNTIEITFSPQNDIDDYIKSQGNFDIGAYIGDPSQTFLPYYPDLYTRANTLLGANNNLNAIAYIRLIKYFDNSLFNMIKDFVPARTNLKSGITIKPHLLNRSKYIQPQVFFSSSIYNGLINTAFIEGGTGGTFDEFNTLTNPSNSQVWNETIITPLGPTQSIHSDQAEFYNGELPYYPTVATNGELNPNNPYKYAFTVDIQYTSRAFAFSFISNSGVSLNQFLTDPIYNPSIGQINYYGYFYDDPSIPIPNYNIFQIIALKINIRDLNNINHSDILSNLYSIIIPVMNAPFTTPLYPQSLLIRIPGNGVLTGDYYTYTSLITNQFKFAPGSSIETGAVEFIPSTNIIWDYYDYNPLINNSFSDTISTYKMKIDYNNGIVIPSNFEAIMINIAERAPVQDSNYSSKAWSNIRYNGSRQSSRNFNKPF
jgi:hypothetical protein